MSVQREDHAGEIELALERLNARKEATGVTDGAGQRIGKDAFLRSISGFDLDPDEIGHIKVAVEQLVHKEVSNGVDPGFVGGGMFLDGLLVGLLIADGREQAGSREGDEGA